MLCNYAVPVPTTHRWGQDHLQGWSQTPAPAQEHCALPAQAACELMLQEGECRALVPKSHLSPNLSLLTSYTPGKSTDACKSKQFLTNTVMSSNRNCTRHWPIYFWTLQHKEILGFLSSRWQTVSAVLGQSHFSQSCLNPPSDWTKASTTKADSSQLPPESTRTPPAPLHKPWLTRPEHAPFTADTLKHT